MQRPFHISFRCRYPAAIADTLKALGATIEVAGDGATLAAFDETVFRILDAALDSNEDAPGTEFTFTVDADEQIRATDAGFAHKVPGFFPTGTHDGKRHVLTFAIGEYVFHLVNEHPSPIVAQDAARPAPNPQP